MDFSAILVSKINFSSKLHRNH